MKNRLMKQMAFVLVVISLITGYSCKKDSSNDQANGGSNYRIKTIQHFTNGIIGETDTFLYSGNKIRSILYYSGSYKSTLGQMSDSTTIDYPDANNATITRSHNSSGNWYQNYREMVILNGGTTTSNIRYQLSFYIWVPYNKFENSYSGGQLVEQIHQYYNTGGSTWQNDMKYSFEYSGTKIIKEVDYDYDYYNGWEVSAQIIFKYNGNKIDSVLIYDTYGTGILALTDKVKFIYSNSKVTQLLYFTFNGYSWEQSFISSFEYDSHGNLASETMTDSGYTSKLVYTYESGSGNYLKLQEMEGNNLFLELIPTPTKSKTLNRMIRDLTVGAVQ